LPGQPFIRDPFFQLLREQLAEHDGLPNPDLSRPPSLSMNLYLAQSFLSFQFFSLLPPT
jgi:hypothetical protein